MKRFFSPWLIAAFSVAFLAVGWPYWRIPYEKVSLPDTLFGPGLLVAAAAAALCRWSGRTAIIPTILVVGSSVPAAVCARVAVELTSDPTSHNLWPFEVVIAGALGLASAALGVLLGSVFLRLTSKRLASGTDPQRSQ